MTSLVARCVWFNGEEHIRLKVMLCVVNVACVASVRLCLCVASGELR